MEFSKTVNSSEELKEGIQFVLDSFKKDGAYIIDRGSNLNFSETFVDGTNSYSSLDLFVERIFKPQYVSMLKKNVRFFEELDRSILDFYAEQKNYLFSISEFKEDIDAEAVNRAKMIAEDLERIIPKIKPTEREDELPFFVNRATNEEIPLMSLKQITDEALEEWAKQLTHFTETFKLTVSPMLMSSYFNPEGLKMRLINTVYWYDLIVC